MKKAQEQAKSSPTPPTAATPRIVPQTSPSDADSKDKFGQESNAEVKFIVKQMSEKDS